MLGRVEAIRMTQEPVFPGRRNSLPAERWRDNQSMKDPNAPCWLESNDVGGVIVRVPPAAGEKPCPLGGEPEGAGHQDHYATHDRYGACQGRPPQFVSKVLSVLPVTVYTAAERRRIMRSAHSCLRPGGKRVSRRRHV